MTAARLSRNQQATATRVANVPREDFERLVESENPPTVSALAELGTGRLAGGGVAVAR